MRPSLIQNSNPKSTYFASMYVSAGVVSKFLPFGMSEHTCYEHVMESLALERLSIIEFSCFRELRVVASASFFGVSDGRIVGKVVGRTNEGRKARGFRYCYSGVCATRKFMVNWALLKLDFSLSNLNSIQHCQLWNSTTGEGKNSDILHFFFLEKLV